MLGSRKREERFSSQRTLGEEAVLASLGITMVGAATFRSWFCDAHAEDEQWHACALPV
jgi:hypothetical protein